MPGAIEAIFVAMISLASLAIPVVILVFILKAVSGSRRSAGLQEDETRMMQEIYRSLGDWKSASMRLRHWCWTRRTKRERTSNRTGHGR